MPRKTRNSGRRASTPPSKPSSPKDFSPLADDDYEPSPDSRTMPPVDNRKMPHVANAPDRRKTPPADIRKMPPVAKSDSLAPDTSKFSPIDPRKVPSVAKLEPLSSDNRQSSPVDKSKLIDDDFLPSNLDFHMQSSPFPEIPAHIDPPLMQPSLSQTPKNRASSDALVFLKYCQDEYSSPMFRQLVNSAHFDISVGDILTAEGTLHPDWHRNIVDPLHTAITTAIYTHGYWNDPDAMARFVAFKRKWKNDLMEEKERFLRFSHNQDSVFFGLNWWIQ